AGEERLFRSVRGAFRYGTPAVRTLFQSNKRVRKAKALKGLSPRPQPEQFAATAPPVRYSLVSLAHPERRDERLLRDVDLAELAHLLLALLLLVEELALACRVAAVALGRHVLAERRDRLAGDDLSADRRLDRDLEKMLRNELLELLDEHPAPL